MDSTRSQNNPRERAALARVTANVGFVTGAHAISRLLHLALVGLVGHSRGSDGVGGYALAAALGGAFVFATDLGLSPRLTRALAARSEGAAKAASRSMGAKLCASLVAFPALAFVPVALSVPTWISHLCLLLMVASFLDSLSFLCYAVSDGYERVDLAGVGALVQAGVWVGLASAAILAGLPMPAVGWAAVAGSAAEFLFSWHCARRFVPITVAKPRLMDIKDSLPYAVTSLTAYGVWQIDVVLVSAVANTLLTGEYASVSRLLLGIGFVPLLISTALFPSVTVSFVRDCPEIFRGLVTQTLRASFVVSGALFLLLLCAARPIMTIVYGAAFSHLDMPLTVGAAFIFLRFVSATLACALTASGRQGVRAGSVITGLAVTCVTILIVFPAMGVVGGVLALIAGEIVSAALIAVASRELFQPWVSFRSLATVTLSVLAGAGSSLLVGSGVVLSLGAGLCTYVSLLWLGAELQSMWRSFKLGLTTAPES